MEYLEMLRIYLGGNYYAMRIFVTLMISSVVVLLIYSPFVGAGLITAIFWPSKLPPFPVAINKWSMLWLKIFGVLFMFSALGYVMYTWEQSVEMILAILVVMLPISIMWVYRDYVRKHILMFWVIIMVVTGASTLGYLLYNSVELRWIIGSIGLAVLIAVIVYWLLAEKIVESYRNFPKLTITTFVSLVIFYPTMWIVIWHNYNVSFFDRPFWYDYVSYGCIVSMLIFSVCLVAAEFMRSIGMGRYQ